MVGIGYGLRASAALALVAGGAGGPAVSQVQPAPLGHAEAAFSPPPPMWRDIASVQILCLVHTPQGVDSGSFTADLCVRAREAAMVGASVPVASVELADPAILKADALTLLVHASIADSPAGPIAAMTVRPFRNMSDDGLLFAAAPRAVLLTDRNRISRNSSLDRVLQAAMADTLPWGCGLPPSRSIDNDRPMFKRLFFGEV